MDEQWQSEQEWQNESGAFDEEEYAYERMLENADNKRKENLTESRVSATTYSTTDLCQKPF